ncbi:MAG: nitroreductase family deazaflavin-dependent oxidoreductase [Actinomycetota bacterium]|nr:nitroreductase family deazaflavin-dependent oxidoreductase [Actinomycetota bacterium]
MTTLPRMPEPGTLGAKLTNNFIKLNTLLYRLSGGRIANTLNKGKAPLLLLDHVGRKSGTKRTTPVIYLEDDDKLVIVGSRGGSDAMPAWWLNLQANPTTTVQVKRDRRTMTAREATPEEREHYWPSLTEMYPDYAVYRSRTDRKLPVIVLSPA